MSFWNWIGLPSAADIQGLKEASLEQMEVLSTLTAVNADIQELKASSVRQMEVLSTLTAVNTDIQELKASSVRQMEVLSTLTAVNADIQELKGLSVRQMEVLSTLTAVNTDIQELKASSLKQVEALSTLTALNKDVIQLLERVNDISEKFGCGADISRGAFSYDYETVRDSFKQPKLVEYTPAGLSENGQKQSKNDERAPGGMRSPKPTFATSHCKLTNRRYFANNR